MCSTSTEAFLGAAEELLSAANGSSGGGGGGTSTPRAVRTARALGKGGVACTSTPPAVVQQRRTARVGYGGGVPRVLACDAAERRKYLERRASALRRGACALCLKKARVGAAVPGSNGARALDVHDNCAASVHVQCYSDAKRAQERGGHGALAPHDALCGVDHHWEDAECAAVQKAATDKALHAPPFGGMVHAGDGGGEGGIEGGGDKLRFKIANDARAFAKWCNWFAKRASSERKGLGPCPPPTLSPCSRYIVIGL